MDFNFNSFNSKDLRNLAKYKFWNSLGMTQRCQNMEEWTLYKEKIVIYIFMH